MKGQGFLEVARRGRWFGAALLLHILVLGPLVTLKRTAPLQSAPQGEDVVAIEIIELASVQPPTIADQVAEPVEPAPVTPAPMPTPQQAAPRPAPEISVPIVRSAPPAPPTVIIRQSLQPQDAKQTSVVQQPKPSGGGQIGGAEQLALRAIFCRDMTEWQRQDAGCAELDTARQQYAPLYEATPLGDYTKIQETQAALLMRSAGEGAAEAFLARNSGIPDTFFNGREGAIMPDNNPMVIDNSIFQKRRPPEAAAATRIENGQAPDWESDVRRAHGTD